MQPAQRGTEFRVEPEPPAWQRALVTSAWRTSLLSGVVTVVLGVIVALHPSGSLSVIAVLLGILLVASGLVHLVRALDRRQEHRGWLGIVGLLLIVFGVLLIQHIDLTIGVIGMLIGVAWILQGLAWLLSGLQARAVRGHGWQVFFGAISLIAGLVVIATPVSSVTALASLVGICFAVLGTAEIIGALIYSRPSSRARVTAAGRADTPSLR